jgi:hypothetical protein
MTRITAYDHYTTFNHATEEQSDKCVICFRGEVVDEDEIYVHVASKTATFYYPTGAVETGGEPYFHKVLKSTIIKRMDVEMDWGGEDERIYS